MGGGGGGGAGAGWFNVHSVYSMQDRFGDVWRWVSEGGTVCETSCAALDSRLKDGTEQEMYGGGNGHILAGTRYYPPHYPPRAPISSSIQRLFVSRLPAWLSGERRAMVLDYDGRYAGRIWISHPRSCCYVWILSRLQ